MQGKLMDVLADLSESEFERKNKFALLNENFRRE